MRFSTAILLEDSIADARLFLQAAKACGAESITWFDSPQRFVDSMSRNITVPDVIFLDLNMPGLDGLSVLGLIRAHHRFGGVPVVIFTTPEDARARDRAMLLGADGFVQKPFSLAEYEETVASLMAEWMAICPCESKSPTAPNTPAPIRQ